MREPHDGTLGHRLVLVDHIFDGCGTHVMPRDDYHVVDPSSDAVIPHLVAQGTVSRKVFTRELREIGVDKSLVIAPDGSCHPGPRISDAEVARFLVLFDLVAQVVHQHRLDTRERQRRVGRLGRCHERDRRYHDAARLCLPPCIHQGATFVPHVHVVPVPRLLVDGFAHRANYLE